MRSEKGFTCYTKDDDVLKKFLLNSRGTSDAIVSRNECENYCSTQRNCWGCSVNCNKTCQWNALTGCRDQRPWKGLIKGDITQKTGKSSSLM